ncbi:MAG: phosphoglycolate phosphatase [Hyphomicrobiaceae bacterium]
MDSALPSWPRAVVFDLDGTLVDSAPDIKAALNATLATDGLAPFDVDRVKTMVGGGSRRLVERALAARGDAVDDGRVDRLVDIFEKIYADNPCQETRIFPGAVSLIETLTARGIGIGLCTNKPGGATLPLLEALDLARHFGAVVTGSDGFAKKPDAAMLAATFAKLGCTAEDGVMVGDSAADVGCARAAGCPVVLVSFGYTHEPASTLGADAVADGFDEILPILQTIGRSHMRA